MLYDFENATKNVKVFGNEHQSWIFRKAFKQKKKKQKLRIRTRI